MYNVAISPAWAIKTCSKTLYTIGTQFITRGTYLQKASHTMPSLATTVETLSITGRVAGKGLDTSVN